MLRWLFATLICIALPCTSLAATEIEISAPGEQSIPLALTKFLPDQGTTSADVAGELDEVLDADLDLSGLFRFVDPAAFLDDAKKIGLYSTQVNFSQWRLLGAEALIKGTYKLTGEELVVEARLFDVVNRRLLTGRRYVGKLKDVRRMAHAFADLVLKALTGEEGPFSSRIAYISDQTGDKELWLMDVDGKRPLRLTNHRSIVLNPDFSPRGKEILFTSYRANNPDLYRKEIYTGKEAKLSYKSGLNVAGRMSPNEREIALTLSKDGNPEIYLINTRGRIIKKVTDNWGIDSDPSWSPDGSQLTFVSNRQGNPHIFITDIFTGKTRRLTSRGKYNATPAWSPKGDRIAFTRQEKGRFDIYTINVDGTDERRLTFG
ncbi:MAG: Tol-Pal system beta propeller repeat protein TolB, partial [Gammaproteobacteria bacterium]|nr:Tol-Pal system beta propeller repeat protein TolB [Gammaproteobacteria bacterium]